MMNFILFRISFVRRFLYVRQMKTRVEFFLANSQRRGVVKTENRPPIEIQLCIVDFIFLVEKYKFSLKLDNFNDSKL